MNKSESMRGIILCRIFIFYAKKIKNTTLRYDWDPPPVSTIMEKIYEDSFNIQKNNHKEKI